MATLRMTADSVLTTVSTTANTITDLVNSVGTGAKMINDFTTNAREQQLTNIKLGKVAFVDQAITSKAIEIAKSRAVLSDYVAANPGQQSDIEKILKQLTEALA